jgi:hypothetical protein
MNQRLFSMAILISALPLFAAAESQNITLNKGDFLSAERLSRNGETIVSVKLSKSGKAKVKKLKAEKGSVHVDLAGVSKDLQMKEPIRGDGLEMGPYGRLEAQKVIAQINKK